MKHPTFPKKCLSPPNLLGMFPPWIPRFFRVTNFLNPRKWTVEDDTGQRQRSCFQPNRKVGRARKQVQQLFKKRKLHLLDITQKWHRPRTWTPYNRVLIIKLWYSLAYDHDESALILLNIPKLALTSELAELTHFFAALEYDQEFLYGTSKCRYSLVTPIFSSQNWNEEYLSMKAFSPLWNITIFMFSVVHF